jgi:hypothetical protein
MSIRSLVVTACCITLLPLGVAAQSVGGGIKGGLTLGDVPNSLDNFDEPGASTSLRVGFAAGGFLAIRFGGGFSIQPEVLFTQKGVKLEVSESGLSGDVTYKADYLDVPILARYTFGKGLRGYVFIGPSLDFKLNAKMKVGILGESEEEDISEDVEDFEFALAFGGGVELGPVLLEARWSEGLTNLNTAKDEPELKSRTILFLFGFRF